MIFNFNQFLGLKRIKFRYGDKKKDTGSLLLLSPEQAKTPAQLSTRPDSLPAVISKSNPDPAVNGSPAAQIICTQARSWLLVEAV